ncbi:MAG: TlpA family protein disulfide reductase [Rhodospirillaceae bacterium]|jgi:thiol-disulfide isomerase/thioredoxin|nr:TlpA family protein disulfide reductase [Rhodospirillaceae bacterium]MBT4587727.1 TlpA family protein disulfide reductase [Rhodospirillaceae bacterium]MBT5940720.1 TlpA family protein disulfide reductase [Rhodospirillaceae bacterium]MBT7267055.1 TlpA family protein disulfide reductase [Rhodospirillaceae bacterium]
MISLLRCPLFKTSRVLAVAAIGIVLTFQNIAYAKGPKLSGAMQVFQLAPSTLPRPSASDGATWKDSKGNDLTLADFKGKVVMVNYWATWCPPCIRELPSIDRLQAALGGKDFTVVAISIDRGGKPIARRMVKRLKLKHLALYLDRESKSARKLGVKSMPTTFIFDRQGREVGKLEGGAEWDDAEAMALVKFFIDNPGYADSLPAKK